MFTIQLPYYDISGDLTPLVLSAMADHGAISAIDPQNPDIIILTFDDQQAYDDFNTAVSGIIDSTPIGG